MSGELLVTIDEAARRLMLSRRSVQGLIYAGDLPSVKVGRSRRLAVVDLDAFVERLRQEDDHEVEPLAVVGEANHVTSFAQHNATLNPRADGRET